MQRRHFLQMTAAALLCPAACVTQRADASQLATIKKYAAIACILLLTTSCAHGYGKAPESMDGLYRVVWSDGTKNDAIFRIKNIADGVWYLSDEKETDGYKLYKIKRDEIEGILGKEIADKSFCIGYHGAGTYIICKTTPGITTEYKSHDFFTRSYKFITASEYLCYIEMDGIFNVEKMSNHAP